MTMIWVKAIKFTIVAAIWNDVIAHVVIAKYFLLNMFCLSDSIDI